MRGQPYKYHTCVYIGALICMYKLRSFHPNFRTSDIQLIYTGEKNQSVKLRPAVSGACSTYWAWGCLRPQQQSLQGYLGAQLSLVLEQAWQLAGRWVSGFPKPAWVRPLCCALRASGPGASQQSYHHRTP